MEDRRQPSLAAEVVRSSYAPLVRIEVVWPIGHPVLRARCVLSGERERGKAAIQGHVCLVTEQQHDRS
jgi:hypothetical protein